MSNIETKVWLKWIIIIVLLLLIIFAIFFISSYIYGIYIVDLEINYERELKSLTAEELVEENIKCINEHNKFKYKLTFILEKRNGQDILGDIEQWSLLDIREIAIDSEYKNTYANVYDMKRFRVSYEVKWKRNPPYNNGTYFWTYTVVKPEENGRWYIATCGF